MFSNDPLDLDGVPRLGGDDFRPLDPAHRRLILISHLVTGLCVGIAGAAASAVIGLLGGLVALAILVMIAVSARLSLLSVRHTGWLVRERDLSYRHGVVVRSVETLPFARIQHAKIERGPLQRVLGLATMQVNTAGPDLQITGLSLADAERLKTLVVERSDAIVDGTDEA